MDLSNNNSARVIFDHALQSVLPESALRRCVSLEGPPDRLSVAGRVYDLGAYDRIFVVGGGKAARRTGAELARILSGRISEGILSVYRDQSDEPISPNIDLYGADHPVPNEAGVAGAARMIELLKRADARTLVIALISGGGSSLMALPVEGITLEDYMAISRLLLTVPASIDEINAVRKHMDSLKGGGMRKFGRKAGAFISLVLSDVPVTKTGVVDDPSVIASGPTVGDDSTFASAKKVLMDHRLWEAAPKALRDYFEKNLGKEENETLPKESPLLAPDRSQYVIIANNDGAMEAAAEKARDLGYSVRLIGCRTGSVADKIKSEVEREIENIWRVVTPSLSPDDQVTFASFSTDGVDGHSSLAGAVADRSTLKSAEGLGLDYEEALANYDSATFFSKLGLGIETGPTGTNVADLSLVLTSGPRRKLAFIFGGEATVHMRLPEGRKPGFGGRNTHLTLLAAEKLSALK